MRSSQISFLALIPLALTGCGTVHNLKDSPNGPMFIGTGRCYPFGGVTRSSLLAVMGPPFGLGETIKGDIAICRGDFDSGFDQVGNGLFLTAAGLGAIIDTPLSLVGDILTFPIAYARSKEYAWATWWGEKSVRVPNDSSGSAAAGAKKNSDGGIKPSD
jgi:uncharacterized protein YceK